MADYLVRLALDSPLATPPVSGTLFGQLCWAWRELADEASLRSWLDSLRQEPFLLSSPCPAGYLPRPLLEPDLPRRPAALEQAKKLRKVEWLALEDFLELRGAMSERAVMARIETRRNSAPRLLPQRTAHNTINRLTGRTPAAGGLYFVDESWPAGTHELDVYVRTSLEKERLE